jgi:hypothetical protein
VEVLLVSLFNVKWRCYAQAGGVDESKFCLFSVIFLVRCISSISLRFYFRRHAFCFLPLSAILIISYISVNIKLDHFHIDILFICVILFSSFFTSLVKSLRSFEIKYVNILPCIASEICIFFLLWCFIFWFYINYVLKYGHILFLKKIPKVTCDYNK